MHEEMNKYRKGILLACAGALLHNLGKVSSRFVERQVPPKGRKNYEYQHICGLFVEDIDKQGKTSQLPNKWRKRYKALKSSPDNKDILSEQTLCFLKTKIDLLPPPLNDRPFPYRIGDLIEYLGQGNHLYPCDFTQIFANNCKNYKNCNNNCVQPTSFLTHLMNRAHHGASGGEKRDIVALQQRFPLYLATPMGYEKQVPDLRGYDLIKEAVEKVIQECLSNPDTFSLREFADKLKPLLSQIPADTQRGVNDITVWDIGHTGMAFLKAGIWSLAKKQCSHYSLGEWHNCDHPRWRLWRVGLDGLNFLCDAVSIADLRVRQRKWQEYLDAVSHFAEDACPVATEVYRDENGAIYVFPDWQKEEYKSFANQIDAFVGTSCSLVKMFGLKPAPALSDKQFHNHPECKDDKSKNISYIGERVKEWIAEPLASQPDYQVYRESSNEKPDDLCPYCGVRAVGGGANQIPAEAAKGYNKEEARQRKICWVCMYERLGVAQDWWKEKPFSTIWVDEVADSNGRVALVTGRFGVEKMLEELVYPMLKSLNSFEVKATYSDSFARFRRVWETTAQFWQEVASPEEAFPEKAAWHKALANSLAVKTAGGDGVCRRLLLKTKANLDVHPFHAYELTVVGVKMGVVCIKDKDKEKEFVTIENLGYIARRMGCSEKQVSDLCAAAAYVLTRLRGKEGYLEKSLGYGQRGKSMAGNGSLTIEEASFARDSYHPVIPILAEPRVFAALVPAKMAFGLVRSIKEKYEKEMGKVRCRLPLALGLVYFEKHTPLRMVFDAGWRMLKRLDASRPQLGEITGKSCLGYSYLEEVKDNEVAITPHPQGKPWPAAIHITFQVVEPSSSLEATTTEGSNTPDFNTLAARKLNWRVATTAGDGRTFDIWYPWVRVEGEVSDRALVLSEPQSSSSHKTTWLHMMELEKGDKINFHPSTFDFLFLDYAGRRFELAYDEKGRRLGLPLRPYYLEEVDLLAELWDILGGKKGLSETQLHAVRQVLYSKWQDWRVGKGDSLVEEKTWKNFCRDTLLNIKWASGKKLGDKEMEKLKVAAESGILFDVYELFLASLKDSPSGCKD